MNWGIIMAKTLPGQIYASDETTPAPEPLPYRAFKLETGNISCYTGNITAIGTNTKFTEELSIGQSLLIDGHIIKIAGIQDDITLIFNTPWEYNTIEHISLYVYKFRPFSEFFGIYQYADQYQLGESGLRLIDIMPNFKRPIREVDSTATIPTWASSANTATSPSVQTITRFESKHNSEYDDGTYPPRYAE